MKTPIKQVNQRKQCFGKLTGERSIFWARTQDARAFGVLHGQLFRLHKGSRTTPAKFQCNWSRKQSPGERQHVGDKYHSLSNRNSRARSAPMTFPLCLTRVVLHHQKTEV